MLPSAAGPYVQPARINLDSAVEASAPRSSELARDLSSVGLAKEDSEVRIARERASYTGHLTGSCPRVSNVIFA
jgi:hypothetical protein